jgi:excisionase family DNA binding protein
LLPGNKKLVKGEIMLHVATPCNIQQQAATMSTNIRLEKTCQHCGEKFIAKTTVTMFCSDNCAKRNYKKRKREEKIEIAIRKEKEPKPFDSIVNLKEFLSIEEACQLIGASRWTIYRLIDKGNLRAGKIGTRTIIKRKEIDKLFT